MRQQQYGDFTFLKECCGVCTLRYNLGYDRLNLMGTFRCCHFCFVFLATVATVQALAFDPWALEKGQFQAQFTTVWTNFDTLNIFNDSNQKIGKVRLVSHQLSGQYGLLDFLTVELAIPFELATQDGVVAPENQKFGDGRLGLGFRVLNEKNNAPVSASLGTAIKVPLSDYATPQLSALGDGQVDFDLRLAVGRFFNFIGRPWWARADFGYRFRTGAPANETFSYLELGTDLGANTMVRIFLDQVNSTAGLGLQSPQFFSIASATGGKPFPSVEEEFIKLGLGVSFQLSELMSISLFWSENIHSRNTSFDRNIGIGFGISA